MPHYICECPFGFLELLHDVRIGLWPNGIRDKWLGSARSKEHSESIGRPGRGIRSDGGHGSNAEVLQEQVMYVGGVNLIGPQQVGRLGRQERTF